MPEAIQAATTPRGAHHARRARLTKALWKALKYLVLIFFLVVFLYPVFLVWSAALRSGDEINLRPFALPLHPIWSNLANAWVTGKFGSYTGNSALYCATIVSAGVMIASFAGYALAQLDLPGRNVILIVFLLGIMVPFQSVMIPLYYLLRDFHVLGTYWAFILPGTALGLPFGIFLMRGFFLGIPRELGYAARIDGANEWQVFWRVMFPLARPGLSPLVIFQFIGTWNAFLIPLIFVQRESLRPVQLGMMFFSGRFTSDRGMIAAGATITMLPVVILYLLLQRQFVRGITAGALRM